MTGPSEAKTDRAVQQNTELVSSLPGGNLPKNESISIEGHFHFTVAHLLT